MQCQRPDPAAAQMHIYRWLLGNPNGPPSFEEQEDTLLLAMERAQSPSEAAVVVLETVADRMAAASVTPLD